MLKLKKDMFLIIVSAKFKKKDKILVELKKNVRCFILISKESYIINFSLNKLNLNKILKFSIKHVINIGFLFLIYDKKFERYCQESYFLAKIDFS